MKYLSSFCSVIISIILNILLLPFTIVLFVVRFFLRSSEELSTESKDTIAVDQEGHSVNMNYDSLDENGQKVVREQITKEFDFPRYSGEVKHAYELKSVNNSKSCPRCKSEVVQCYSNFIYATQIALRAMFTPAGFFCVQCPTVIIDHEMIKNGIDKKYKFRGVVGIDYDTREQPDLFETWNGKKAVYVFDEDQNILGLDTISTKEYSDNNRKKKLQNKKRIAKQSKRKNRKKTK